MNKAIKIIKDPQYGYFRLDPIPSVEELEDFYEEKYFSLIKAGGRAPEIKKLMEGGRKAEEELMWLSQTLWRDVKDIVNEHIKRDHKERLLDFGCGLGHFAKYMQEHGWQVVGVEPSRDAAEVAKSFGVQVYNSLEDCLRYEDIGFDVINLLNVLEHVPDPAGLIKNLRLAMNDGGMIVIRVPNDFSSLQECAQSKLNIEPWWIAVPDHINYFNFDSLNQFLINLNFQILDMLGDFPMEMFLLFGDIYINDPDIGSECHKKRVAFELSIPAELRRQIYRCFAQNGIGRDCLVFAKAIIDK